MQLQLDEIARAYRVLSEGPIAYGFAIAKAAILL